jgi:hypothetical protein
VKLFANFLLVTNNLIYFIYFERLKELWFLSHLLLYIQVPHMLLTLKSYRKM